MATNWHKLKKYLNKDKYQIKGKPADDAMKDKDENRCKWIVCHLMANMFLAFQQY